MTNNAFDFSNVADLPEELAAKLTAETNGNVDTFVNVVAKGKEAGFDTLEINQIMAAAHRLGVDVAADPAATEEAASEAEDQVENEADANEDDDPLAGIE